MAKLRGTDSYVFTNDDLVGKGATCEVYKGINKKTGQVHALKIFDMRLASVSAKEIEALKSLKHDNIVDFIKEDREVSTGKIVAVMEYCEKNLYSVLCEPENTSGLCEDEYMRFFKHIVSGMKHLREHGFLHRDIKPGNILLAQDEDGSNIYKLSDFGTAKPVLEEEAFQSLVGTEEYLHPQIFQAAFIDRLTPREFDAAADLWSLGATLYHTATGKVPFQPYHGRNDKNLMYMMIAKKDFGVIAGEQRSRNGEIIWSKCLPKTCRLSNHLQQALTQILAGLMEVDPRKSMNFEIFFQSADDILDREVFYIFSTTSARHFRLYLKKDVKFSDVQKFIHNETNIPVTSQHILYEECVLKDIIKEDTLLSAYPKTSETTPLILIRSNEVSQCTMPEERNFWYYTIIQDRIPEFQDKIHLQEDVTIARSICDSIANIQHYIRLGCITQELFEKTRIRIERWKDVLVNHLTTEVDLYKGRIKDLRLIHYVVMSAGLSSCPISTDNSELIQMNRSKEKCIQFLDTIKSFSLQDSNLLVEAVCVRENCQKKIARLLQQAKDIRVKFEGRKRNRSLPFHEEQLHRFDRHELLHLLQKATSLRASHCQGKLQQTHQQFLSWHSLFVQIQSNLENLQKEIKVMKAAVRGYVKHFKIGNREHLLDDSMPTLDFSDVNRKPLKLFEDKIGSLPSENSEIKLMAEETKELCLQSMEIVRSLELQSLDETDYHGNTASGLPS